jgi:hypothetical protein
MKATAAKLGAVPEFPEGTAPSSHWPTLPSFATETAPASHAQRYCAIILSHADDTSRLYASRLAVELRGNVPHGCI